VLEPAEVAIDDQPLLRSVFTFIEARFRKPISLGDVARAVGRNPAYITTNVRRRTGLTVGEWIAERRMAHARMLLQALRPQSF
jgi:AraC family transcriptional regulator, transcriptional activator of pobA